MNLLKTIIERLNQRVEVANIFDKQFNLCELNANGNDKAWVHYIGNGQAEVVTNFDAKNGTLFWAKRGKVSVAKTEAYKMSGCKQLYVTTFPLTAYAIVRKSHLPCDAEDAQDWLASRVYKLTSGTDPLFKQSIGVINYEVVPSGYANEIKTLTANYEWACVSVDMDVQVITTSEDGCYDTCATGDIPLPDLQPCVPCLTEVAVDGFTITGNGTTADPLVAVGGGGGAISVEDDGVEVTPIATTLNFTGAGVTASLTSPGVVVVNVPGGSGAVGTLQEVTDLGNSTTNNIAFTASAGLSFDNGAFFHKGTTDAGNGGAKGTAQICSISYELKWEAGRLYYMQQDGFTIRDVTHNFAFVPQITDDSTKGFVVGSRWSLDDGTVYLCSDDTIGAAVWAVVEVGTVTSVTGTSPIASSGGTTPDISISQADTSTDGYLSSADWTTFDGKFDVPTGTNTDYLDGTGTPTLFPTIPAAQVNSDWTAASGVAEILNKPTLATVATSGSYTDLSNQPSIPAAQIQSDWTQSNNAALDYIKNKPTLTNGTVTSVDLSMPAAFSVSGNPVTTSGTLAVTAAGVATQYIRGDGQLANFPTSSGGGSAVSFYLNGSVAQGTLGGVAFKQMSNTPVLGAGTDFSINADGYIQSFITDASVPNQLLIPAGNWNFEMYFSANNAGGSPRFYIDIFKLSAGTLSLIASSSANPEFITNGAVIDLYTTAVAMPSTVLLAADRIAIRVYVIHSSKTITLHTEDSHLCQVLTTFATGLTSLNGLTAQTQLLAVGTSGTDFAISSTTDTHTFNLPTASASNRGALSSADWMTFDAKQATLVSGTNIKTINSTSLLGSGNITIASLGVYKNTTDGAASSAATNTFSQSLLVTGNSIAIGNVLEFKLRGRKTGTGNQFIIRLYANTTNNLSGTPILLATMTSPLTTASSLQILRTGAVKNATTNTEMLLASTTNMTFDYQNTTFSAIAIDWATDKYIIGAVQCLNAADSALISLITMTVI